MVVVVMAVVVVSIVVAVVVGCNGSRRPVKIYEYKFFKNIPNGPDNATGIV
jgi:hypothetical protein